MMLARHSVASPSATPLSNHAVRVPRRLWVTATSRKKVANAVFSISASLKMAGA